MTLVRDKAPEIATANGNPLDYRIASAHDYGEALRDKLFDDVCKFLDGENLDELADVLEVVRALAEEKGVSLEDVVRAANMKREVMGGYVGRIISLEVGN